LIGASGVVVDVLELVLVLSMFGMVVGSLVLSVFLSRVVDVVVATVWLGVSMVVVVLVLVLVASVESLSLSSWMSLSLSLRPLS
jgi:hypothetical protein